MNVLLTGSSGHVGSAVLLYLLDHPDVHHIISLDLNPLPEKITARLQVTDSDRVKHHQLDLADFRKLDEIFSASGQIDGVIHLSAVGGPLVEHASVVHNTNTGLAFNVLQAAATHGVKRIVQASSVNAMGLLYTPEGRQRFDEIPITEEAAKRPMDPYALSKQINELQAEYFTRLHPDIRIASMRFHHVVPTYEVGAKETSWQDIFCWVSEQAASEACFLGLTSEGWEGAEVFNIVAPEICWEADLSPSIPGHEDLIGAPGTLELMEKAWKGRVAKVHGEWWAGRPRRTLFDTRKAERVLGWKHE